MAQPIDNTSGPYPLLIWIGADGEANDQYDWLGEHLSKAGYITVVHHPLNSAKHESMFVDSLFVVSLEYNHNNGSFEEKTCAMLSTYTIGVLAGMG